MGLEGFLGFVKKKFPEVIINEHITLYSHQRIFMDISSYIYKYVCIFGTNNTRWLGCIFQMFLNLKQFKIHVVPIFDGKPPDEKQDEINDRKEKRIQTQNRIKSLEQAVLNFRNKSLTEEDKTLLQDTIQHLEKKNKCTKLKSLLFKFDSSSSISENDIIDIENYIFSIKKTIFYITSKEINLIKELLNIMGIPFIQAPEEAEACCSYLCKQGLGSAVISCDTDCFAHGCPNTILTYDTSTGMITSIRLQQLLEALEMNQTQFIDFAILIGCDYNRKAKLKNVGPVKALQLIHTYNQIEHISEYDFTNIDYKNIRSLFNKDYNMIRVKKHKNIDKDALQNFIDQYNLQVNNIHLDKIIDDCEKSPKIIFIDDN
jgi:flap endonuclease-1